MLQFSSLVLLCLCHENLFLSLYVGPCMCESVHLFSMNLNFVCSCYSCSYVSKIEDNLFFKGGDICNSVVILSKSLILYNVTCNEFSF